MQETSTHLVQVVSSVGIRVVNPNNNVLDLVAARPLDVARVLVDAPDVLAYFWGDRFEQEVIQGIRCVAEDHLGPCKDTELIAK